MIYITNYWYQVGNKKHWFADYNSAHDHFMKSYPSIALMISVAKCIYCKTITLDGADIMRIAARPSFDIFYVDKRYFKSNGQFKGGKS